MNWKITSLLFVDLFYLWIWVAQAIRSCYVCSGADCMQNPHNRSLSPGLIECHPVQEYCTTHFRYLVKNESLASGKALGPGDYLAQSGTRSCAKTYLGNLCRRDYLGRPEITCITTCNKDFCNCDSRSPPRAMFPGGKVLFESPKNTEHFPKDLNSCIAARKSAKKEKTIESKRKKEKRLDEILKMRRRLLKAKRMSRRSVAVCKRARVMTMVLFVCATCMY